MSATIKDIARETGLALATISKYINGGTVRPQNKKQIDEAIRKLNYVPRNTARGLRSSKTYRIGLVSGPPNTPHNAFLLSKIENTMRAHGYSLTFMSGDKYKDHVNKFVPHMLRSGIDGLIITSFSLNQDICSAVEHAKIPVVELEEHSHFHRTDCVQTSCTSGAYEIVEHLIKMGHQKIALVTGLLHPIPHANEKKAISGHWKTTIFLLIPIISSLKITQTTLDIRQCRNYGIFRNVRLPYFLRTIHYASVFMKRSTALASGSRKTCLLSPLMILNCPCCFLLS